MMCSWGLLVIRHRWSQTPIIGIACLAIAIALSAVRAHVYAPVMEKDLLGSWQADYDLTSNLPENAEIKGAPLDLRAATHLHATQVARAIEFKPDGT